jgi:hypothetical protein
LLWGWDCPLLRLTTDAELAHNSVDNPTQEIRMGGVRIDLILTGRVGRAYRGDGLVFLLLLLVVLRSARHLLSLVLQVLGALDGGLYLGVLVHEAAARAFRRRDALDGVRRNRALTEVRHDRRLDWGDRIVRHYAPIEV